MFRLALLLLAAAACSSGSSGFHPSRSQGAHEKDLLDPNVRDWGDYSDLIQEPGRSTEEERGAGPSLAPELDFLAEFAGETGHMTCAFPPRSHDIVLLPR